MNAVAHAAAFPFLFGGAFIEAVSLRCCRSRLDTFPFLLGRAFIEAPWWERPDAAELNFPSFSEGLSLRPYPAP